MPVPTRGASVSNLFSYRHYLNVLQSKYLVPIPSRIVISLPFPFVGILDLVTNML